MIRRPPTLISLGDEEVQHLLQRIFIHTLPGVFDQLQLDDPDQSYDDATFFDPSSSSHSSSGGAEKKMSSNKIHDHAQTPSNTKCQSSSTLHTADPNSSAVRSSSANVGFSHQAMDTKNASLCTATTAPLPSSALSRPRTSPPHERPPRKVAWATLPHDLQRHDSEICRPDRERQVGPCPCAGVIVRRVRGAKTDRIIYHLAENNSRGNSP